MTINCNFCGKQHGKVMCMIIADDYTAICSECVSLCVEIAAGHAAGKPITAPPWHVLADALSENKDGEQNG